MMERRKVRPLEELEIFRSGSKWILQLPGGREARYTEKEIQQYFSRIAFEDVQDPPAPEISRQGKLRWGPEQQLEIVIPTTPQKFVSPNYGAHFSRWAGKQQREEKARLKQASIDAAEELLDYMESEIGAILERPLYGDDARVEVLVEWEKVITPRYKNGAYRHKVDPHDALPAMCKGIIDGLTIAGIIADDRNIDATYEQGKDPAGAGRVTIKVQGATK